MQVKEQGIKHSYFDSNIDEACVQVVVYLIVGYFEH